ncbi:MAG TPA: BlaI/MecI/CopY family transcriptional regulator [Bryobacteraceae bacterium]|nr:BlaI/MecI/CopY family transcriptional regulator [Bryobacteraceae bacterium]
MEHLSRRERQIMDILYRLGNASAAEIRDALPDPPSNSAVRTMLRILEEKGHILHKEENQRYIFLPKVSREKAKRGALRHLIDTFFDGSVEHAVAALLDSKSSKLAADELDRLSRLIEDTRKKGV